MSLLDNDDYLLCLPILIFFYQQMTIGSISVFRLYTIAYFLRFIYAPKHDYNELKHYSLQAFIGLFFSVFVICPRELQRGCFICLDIISIWFITSEIRAKKISTRLLRWIVNAAIVSCFYGYFSHDAIILNEAINGTVYVMERYMGSFNDPNYASLFINIGIIICIANPECFRTKMARYCSLILLTLGLAATISMTGIITLTIILLVFFVLKHNFKGILGIIAIICVLVIISTYYRDINPDGVLGQLYNRIVSKIGYLSNNDYDGFSTDRTSLAIKHWHYFWDQGNGLSILFGGNPISAAYTDRLVINKAAHNEYVDLLLSIGIVGWIAYMGSYLYMYIKDITRLKLYKSSEIYNEKNSLILIRFCYLLYGFTLTMFLDHRFLFLMFI